SSSGRVSSEPSTGPVSSMPSKPSASTSCPASPSAGERSMGGRSSRSRPSGSLMSLLLVRHHRMRERHDVEPLAYGGEWFVRDGEVVDLAEIDRALPAAVEALAEEVADARPAQGRELGVDLAVG